MEDQRAVLVTTTLYQSIKDLRFHLAQQTVKEAVRLGYEIIAVDDSIDPAIKDTLRDHGAMVFDAIESGMGASCREALRHGMDTGAKVIVWLEPEKYPVVSLLGECIMHVLNGKYDIVVPRRQSLVGYPRYQHWSELEANWRLAEITGRPDLDLMMGPRVYSRWAAELTISYNGEKLGYGDNWEILFIPILWVLNAVNARVGAVTIPYTHPKEQTAVEDTPGMNVKRDKQRIDLIRTMATEALRLDYRSLLTCIG